MVILISMSILAYAVCAFFVILIEAKELNRTRAAESAAERAAAARIALREAKIRAGKLGKNWAAAQSPNSNTSN